MKKILFSLMALVCSMSMNAQVMKIMKGNEVVATYTADEADNVVFEEAPLGVGTAKRTGNIDVKWVQLWENGPKFAEYNVGATSATGDGGYFCWGSSIDKDSKLIYKSGSDALTGNDDIATNIWGSAWRMPTKDELDALLANCDVAWTDNYKESDIKGIIFVGKGDYSSNSVFLPAAGYFSGESVKGHCIYGFYWSSTPNNSSDSWFLNLLSGTQRVVPSTRYRGSSVRAVLAE